jgi:hypothetical protein
MPDKALEGGSHPGSLSTVRGGGGGGGGVRWPERVTTGPAAGGGNRRGEGPPGRGEKDAQGRAHCGREMATTAILIHYLGHQSEPAFHLSLPHLSLGLPSHRSATPRPVRCPSFPTATVFHVAHSSHRHGHVRRLPITPNAEADFVFPSSLRHPISIPISPLHRVIFSHRSAAARARHQGPPCRPPEQPPTRLCPHLPEQCPGIELSATKPSPQEVDKAEPTPFAPAVRAPHRRPRTSGRPWSSRPCHELCLVPMLLANNSSSNLRRSSGPSPASLLRSTAHHHRAAASVSHSSPLPQIGPP